MPTYTLAKTATIDAPADRIWEILDNEFSQVGHWASAVDHSTTNLQLVADADGAAQGRVCAVPGFGTTDERVTRHDAASRSFAYTVSAEKLPGFVKGTEIGWSVQRGGPASSVVRWEMTLRTSGIMGALAGPMMKMRLSGIADRTLDDLRTYAVTGRPSDAKQKAKARLTTRG
jgi:hypothetical protein